MNLKSRLVLSAWVLVLGFGGAANAYAQQATLAWDANTESDVAGYRVYYGTRPGQYGPAIDVGKVTKYTVNGLDQSLNYYFAVQAYSSAGLSSALSSEVSLPAPVPPGTTRFTSFNSTAGYPILAGTSVTWTANAVSSMGAVEYKFLLYSKSTGYQVVQDFSPVGSFRWQPTWNDLGQHAVQVWARTVGSVASYEAWVGTSLFDVNASAVQVTADTDFPTAPGNPVQWTASVAGQPAGASLEYKFVLWSKATNAWTVLRDYASSNQTTWTPGSTGTYAIQGWARRTGSTAAYEVYGGTGFLTVSKSTLKITRLDANASFPAYTGMNLTWTVRSQGGTKGPIQYQFVRYSAANGWKVVKAWSTSKTYSWTPTYGEEGQYVLQIWAKNSGSTAAYDAWTGTSFFEIKRAPVQLTSSHQFPVPAGTAVTFTADVDDTSATFEYQYMLYAQATGQWNILQAYSDSPSVTWTPADNGRYALQVWVRRVGTAVPYDAWQGTGYIDVASTPAKLLSVTPSVSLPGTAGTAIKWTAIASGGTASPLQYQFLVYSKSTGWTVARSYSTSTTFTWTPSEAGAYALQVWVKSAGSTAPYESWLGTGYFVIQP
jgi:hypothetical protein